MYVALSWRNIWRNKKRTLIAAASVFFAVLVAVVMRSAQRGSYSYMIHSSAQLFTGYVQVQGNGYWENRSLDQSMILAQSMQHDIATLPHVTIITPRLEAFALASSETTTKVAQVIGIDPLLEDQMTGLQQRLVQGQYLTSDSNGTLVAEGLAQRLNIHLGESLVLYGQGYHGETAAAQVPVIGLVKLPFQEMNTSFVFLTLPAAQSIFSAPARLTSLSIMIDNIRHLEQVLSALRAKLGNDYTLMTWDQMMPDLVQNIQLDNASGIVMLLILYIVIGFGVFGTVMMMVSERAKEFGILISVGMQKWRLLWVTTLETIFIAFIGMVTGMIGSLPLILYLHAHPIRMTGEAAKTFDALGIEAIFNFSTDPTVFINQTFVVFIIALATVLYPVLFILRLEPVKALRV
jgi:ABC-type lipoprotein release transport system permease subunit